MVTPIPPFYIQDPSPNTPRYGLFNAINGPLDLTPVQAREGGYVWETISCELPYGYEVQCTNDAKTFTTGTSTITAVPFVVIGSLVCGTIGHTPEEYRQMAFDRLRLGEQAAVELILSTGAFAQAPSLANNPDSVLLAGSPATDVADAIGQLEA